MRYIWDEIAFPAMFTASGNIVNIHKEDFSNALNLTAWDQQTTSQSKVKQSGDVGLANTDTVSYQKKSQGARLDGIADEDVKRVNNPHGFNTLGRDNIVYVDMLPPFDITMTFANEYGNAAFQRIYDVEILNDASGLSVDSMVMERSMTYIARRMSPLLEGVFKRTGEDITPSPVLQGSTYPNPNVKENRDYKV
ncbi:MAG: hypothetical protein N2043_02220 [Ignavibacterium sp.]|nr:hypothetical protein [Ignavibacterium sp.]